MLERLYMNIRGARFDGALDELIDEAHHRRFARQIAKMGGVGIVVYFAVKICSNLFEIPALAPPRECVHSVSDRG